MFLKFAKKIFGSANDRFLKKLEKQVSEINKLEKKYQNLSDKDFNNKTNEFKNRIKKGETLDDILVESFAIVREAAKRTLNQRLYSYLITPQVFQINKYNTRRLHLVFVKF